MWNQQNRQNALESEPEIISSEDLHPVPTEVGNYEIEDIIAEGGMAIVYRAYKRGPTGFRKPVALKSMRPDLEGTESALSMFTHEAVLGAMLDHPNLVTVYDFGRMDEQWFIAMEYVEGINLRNAMDAVGGPWPQQLAAYVILQVAKGLAFAHELTDDAGRPLSLVHRDVTPKNVLMSTRGEVKLGDFGIVEFSGRGKYTGRGEVRGKLAYLSPEQALGRVLDFRTDIYSLGLVLWEMLTGRPRYNVNSPDVYTDVLIGEYLPVSVAGVRVDPAMETILRRMLARNVEDRWESGRQLVRALQEYVAGYDGSHEIQELVAGVRAGRRSVDLGVDLPTKVNPAGNTREFAKASLEAGRTVLLEENIPTRLVPREELKAVEMRVNETDLHHVSGNGLWSGFLRGVLTGLVSSSVMAGGLFLYQGSEYRMVPFHDSEPVQTHASASPARRASSVEGSGSSGKVDVTTGDMKNINNINKLQGIARLDIQREVNSGQASVAKRDDKSERHSGTTRSRKKRSLHRKRKSSPLRMARRTPSAVSGPRIIYGRRTSESVRPAQEVLLTQEPPRHSGGAVDIEIPPELKPFDYSPPVASR